MSAVATAATTSRWRSISRAPRRWTCPAEPDAAPLADFSLNDLDTRPTPDGRTPADKTWRPDGTTAGLELPLFTLDGSDDRPLVTPPAVPRAPLAVRRATPAVPRLRTPAAEPPERPLPLDLDAPVEPAPPPVPAPDRAAGPSPVGPARRLGAAAIDAVIVGAIDLAVLYLTTKIAGLGGGELHLLPKTPLIAFLVLLDGGYLVGFVATVGQTIGKMATGLKVVDAGGGLPTVGQASLRALATLLSIAPLGLGYVPALAGGEGRALHDRLADTRVVEVS